MKNLKRVTAFALSLVLLGCALPASANASCTQEGLVSIEVISNKLCKRGVINTTIHKYKFSHGVPQTIAISGFDSDDLIYFIIDPNQYTYMTHDST